MKRSNWILLIFISMLLLAGCGQSLAAADGGSMSGGGSLPV